MRKNDNMHSVPGKPGVLAPPNASWTALLGLTPGQIDKNAAQPRGAGTPARDQHFHQSEEAHQPDGKPSYWGFGDLHDHEARNYPLAHYPPPKPEPLPLAHPGDIKIELLSKRLDGGTGRGSGMQEASRVAADTRARAAKARGDLARNRARIEQDIEDNPYRGRDLFDRATNFFSGAGDSLTMGGTGVVRDVIGTNNVVDPDSDDYHLGEDVELGVELLSGGLSAGLKAALRRKLLKIGKEGIEKEVRNQVRKTVAEQVRKGKVVPVKGMERHHQNPLSGHPVSLTRGKTVHTLFPTAGLPATIHSGARNLKVFAGKQKAVNIVDHMAAHRKLLEQERILKGISNRYISPARVGRVVVNKDQHNN